LEFSLLGVVGTELVAEECSLCAAPALHLIVCDAKWLPAVSTFCQCYIFEFVRAHRHHTPPGGWSATQKLHENISGPVWPSHCAGLPHGARHFHRVQSWAGPHPSRRTTSDIRHREATVAPDSFSNVAVRRRGARFGERPRLGGVPAAGARRLYAPPPPHREAGEIRPAKSAHLPAGSPQKGATNLPHQNQEVGPLPSA
jgi:hypothetical protein